MITAVPEIEHDFPYDWAFTADFGPATQRKARYAPSLIKLVTLSTGLILGWSVGHLMTNHRKGK